MEDDGREEGREDGAWEEAGREGTVEGSMVVSSSMDVLLKWMGSDVMMMRGWWCSASHTNNKETRDLY